VMARVVLPVQVLLVQAQPAAQEQPRAVRAQAPQRAAVLPVPPTVAARVAAFLEARRNRQ